MVFTNDLHLLCNGDLYAAIEDCYINDEDDSELIEEMNARGFDDIESFGRNSSLLYYGRFETHAEYVDFLEAQN